MLLFVSLVSSANMLNKKPTKMETQLGSTLYYRAILKILQYILGPVPIRLE